MADAFRTGHKPAETFEQLVSRLNAGSPIAKDVPVTGQGRPRVRRLKTKAERIAARCEGFTGVQLQMLFELLDGRRALVHSEGRKYAVARVDAHTFRVCGLHAEAVDRTTTAVACTCDDSKFRNRKCRHMRALEGLRDDGPAS